MSGPTGSKQAVPAPIPSGARKEKNMNDAQNVNDPNQSPTPPVAVPPVETSAEYVSRKDHERAINDMHAFKKEALELKARLKVEEDNKLKEKEQWKELYEKAESERQKAEDHSKKLQESYINSQRFSALKSECQKLGILDSAARDLDMIDLEQVKFETTSTGRVNVLNAKEVAEDVKRTRPHWFGKPGVPSVNTSTPQVMGSGEAMTYEQVMKLEQQWRKTKSLQDEQAYKKALLSMKGHKA